jgi:hypothetical protein
MGRIITLFLAVLVTPVIVFLTPQAKAQTSAQPYQSSRSELQAAAQRGDDAPGAVERHEYQSPIYRGKLTPAQALERRSYAIFPRAALDAHENAKREQWMADQEQRAIANDINRTKPQFYPASER